MSAQWPYMVTRIASHSNPGHAYEIRSNGTDISCECPGWTRQSHLSTCTAMRGGTCSCRASTLPKTKRTCRHVREAWRRIGLAGGLAQTLLLAQRGITLSDSEEAAMPRVPAPTVSATLSADADRVLVAGAARVLVNKDGLYVVPQVARTRYNVVPDVVFIKSTGWTLGVPTALETQAQSMTSEWVGVLRLDTKRTQPYEEYARQQGIATRSRARAVAVPDGPQMAVPISDNDMSWIGGNRAILLMD